MRLTLPGHGGSPTASFPRSVLPGTRLSPGQRGPSLNSSSVWGSWLLPELQLSMRPLVCSDPGMQLTSLNSLRGSQRARRGRPGPSCRGCLLYRKLGCRRHDFRGAGQPSCSYMRAFFLKFKALTHTPCLVSPGVAL